MLHVLRRSNRANCSFVDHAAPQRDGSPVWRRRASNERIAAAALSHRFDRLTAVPFICECADDECSELLRLTLDELTGARKLGAAIVAPGHAVVDRSVRSERGYWIVD
jgi:hypothetical protein